MRKPLKMYGVVPAIAKSPGSIVASARCFPVMYIDTYSEVDDSMYVMPTSPMGSMSADGKYVKTPAPGSMTPDWERVGATVLPVLKSYQRAFATPVASFTV